MVLPFCLVHLVLYTRPRGIDQLTYSTLSAQTTISLHVHTACCTRAHLRHVKLSSVPLTKPVRGGLPLVTWVSTNSSSAHLLCVSVLRGFSEMEKDSQQNVSEGQSEGVAQAGWGVDGNVDGQQERNEDLVSLARSYFTVARVRASSSDALSSTTLPSSGSACQFGVVQDLNVELDCVLPSQLTDLGHPAQRTTAQTSRRGNWVQHATRN